MAYVAVVKALYDYAPQDAETELALKEDDIAYIIEKEDDDWWKAKLKDVGGVEGAVGLVPVTYVEELPPLDTVRALYAYESTTAEELSMDEDDTCHVFSEEDDWLLVRIEGKGDTLGFVPKTYCDPIDATHGVEVADAAEGEAEVEAARAEEARHREMAERQRQLKLKDKVETWSVSEVDGRKKKKGTLGVGNGAVFFASDTDKSPVKQYPITDLQNVTQTSSKEISLAFALSILLVHCGSSDNARAILAKLETSKEAAGEALETIEAETAASDSEEEAAPEPKAVRWAPEPSAASPAAPSPAVATRNGSSGGEKAVVLYDFDAQGDDELTVKENDSITLVDRSDDEWWLVRNARGQEGVVPAQYVQIGGDAPSAGGEDAGYDAEEQRMHEEEEAAAAAALEAERQRERAQKAEQRRAIERAAKEKMAQEEEDRQLALDLEKREVEKQIRREQKREMDALQKREDEHRARREATRGREPPKIAKRPSANDVAAAAARLPDRGRGVPDKPDDSRPKPNSGRIRTWSDKSGQFQVDAEYLGMNGHKIRLHKINGVIIEVPLEKMSHEDAQMIKRYEARKQRQMEEDDDIPLGRTPRKNGRGDRERERSEETRARQTPPSPARKGPSPVHQQQQQQQQKPRKPAFDWFAFFLEAGCGMDDCTRYAANFERDRIDESLLPDLDASTLRSLGLKEGDVLRVRKDIANKYAKKTPEQEAQIKQDEEYARQLQEYERGGGKGPIPQPPPSLFTGPSGKLANNTRRGRPDRKGTIDSVDPGAIAGLTDQLSKMNTGSSSAAAAPAQSSSPSPQPPAPSIQLSPVEDKKEKEEKLIPGFDDDAWTIKPSTSKPASPAPGGTGPSSSLGGNATTPAPGSANGTDSLLAQIHALRPANTGRAGNSMSPIQQTQTGSSSGFSGPSNYGLGAQGTGQSMGAMMNYQQQQNNLVQTQSPQPTGQQQYNPNGARGPLAPVASNEALLNPMMPQQTGMFVPTRGSPAGQQQQQQQMSPMATGMMPQQTGFMMPQATGYAAGFQQGYGMQANYTGMPSTGPGQQFGQGVQQNAQNLFNNIANVPLQGQVTGMQQPQQQGGGDKFAPGNIFAAMKKSEFGKPEEQQPQNSGKYDALRPLTTGYNGGPGMMGGGMMPQQTGMMGGMMPQQTGMMMGSQQTGMYGGGMMPQMTGYNPYAGQNQYGQFR